MTISRSVLVHSMAVDLFKGGSLSLLEGFFSAITNEILREREAAGLSVGRFRIAVEFEAADQDKFQ